MSILPFISFFLITIAGFFIAMQNISESGCYRSILLLGEFHAERKARNEMQNFLFESIAEIDLNASKVTREKKEDRAVSGLRTFKRISEKHKVNIYRLLETPNPENTELYSFSLQLIAALYRHCDFYTERFPKTILHCLLESGKKVINPENQLHILQIIPSISTGLEDHVIYQILRGTNYYNLEKQVGIPPLLDFFTISSDKKHKPLYFPLLRRVYVSVAFGERCAGALLLREEEKRENNKNLEKKNRTPILIKSEIAEILERVPQETPFHLDEIMAYSRPRIGKFDKQQMQGVDKNTGIHIRKNF